MQAKGFVSLGITVLTEGGLTYVASAIADLFIDVVPAEDLVDCLSVSFFL